MNDVKFRFVNRLKKTGEIYFIYTSVNALEMQDSWEGKVHYERIGIELCTGSKDKNGKEIYKGHVLRWGDLIGFVDFDDGVYMFYEIEPFLDCEQYQTELHTLILEQPNDVEIIGNIHKKADLLVRQEAEPIK